MRKKQAGIWICAALLVTGLAGGCSSDVDIQTEPKVQETQPVSLQPLETQAMPETVVETGAETASEDTEAFETEIVGSEEYIDQPAAIGGEGDTNGFYDDAGTWITVYKNANGDWVDESGMIYEFGDEGVTDQNGVFYPY